MNIRHHRPLGQVVCALAAIALLVATAGTAPADAKAKKRPDLIVKAGRIAVPGQGHLGFIAGRGGTTRFTWEQTTQNKGQATAPKSRTGVQVVVDARHVVNVARETVPQLGRGRSHASNGRFNVRWDPTWDYGTYATRICADVTRRVAESKEGKNCRKAHTIWVVPYELTGTLSGEATQASVLPGVTLRWEFPAGVTFRIDDGVQPFAGQGILNYSFLDPAPASGVLDLQYTISGTNSLDGCTWEGTGGYEPVAQFHKIELSFGRPRGLAHAQILVDRGLPQFHFTATVTCNGNVGQVDVVPANWGRAAYWFDLGPTAGRFPDPGLTRLEGDHTDTNATYHWNLTPVDFHP